MRAVGGGYVAFFVTAEKLGRNYHEKLATQDIQFTRKMREAERRVARGEMAIYMPFVLSDIQNLKGLPVRSVVPEEGAPMPFMRRQCSKAHHHIRMQHAFILISQCRKRSRRYSRRTGLASFDAAF